jgi:hypothetical protein
VVDQRTQVSHQHQVLPSTYLSVASEPVGAVYFQGVLGAFSLVSILIAPVRTTTRAATATATATTTTIGTSVVVVVVAVGLSRIGTLFCPMSGLTTLVTSVFEGVTRGTLLHEDVAVATRLPNPAGGALESPACWAGSRGGVDTESSVLHHN